MVKEYYTVREMAEILGLHEKTVQRYIREGQIKAQKIGKSWRVTKEDLEDFTGMSIERRSPEEQKTLKRKPKQRISVSAVVDIDACEKEEAIRISNTLSAVLNSRHYDFSGCTLHTQYLEGEYQLRLMLWGHPHFIENILGSVSVLVL